MEYLKIQGVEIPTLGLGTWKILGNHAIQRIKHALDIGYRLIDTAQIYQNEAVIGNAISRAQIDREELFLVTKLWATNLSYHRVIESLENSLQRLNTSYIDLLLIHRPNHNVPLRETFHAMAHLQTHGKVRHIGVSNFPLPLLQKAHNVSPIPLLVDQVPYHPFLSQTDLLEFCQNHNMLLMAYSPLAQGNVITNPLLKALGSRYSKSPVQVTLRWLVQQDNVVAIPKAIQPTHQQANINIFDFQLSSTEMKLIKSLSHKHFSTDSMWKLTQYINHLPINVAKRIDSFFIALSTTFAPLWTTPS